MNTTTTAHATPAGGLAPELKWTLTKIHATTLLLAWFFLVPSLGLLWPDFCGDSPPSDRKVSPPVRPSLWFHAHRATNLMALSLMFLGLLTILVAHEWRWLGPTPSASSLPAFILANDSPVPRWRSPSAFRSLGSSWWRLLVWILSTCCRAFGQSAERDEEKRGFPETDYFLLHISIFVLAALCFCLCCLVWLKAPA
ncbi:Ferric-chelate reductase 1 [Aphelenchoides fujianensis]|nr:Ferric-chelate reductase 1 [Aphelenchoides fujianensis]